ncbi:MAG TPA: hypothetical protein VMO52_04890 [Acidimicrobiia bacterium]|nr:hypothetical protein [Acidimicrobiia bacterium]
MSDEKILDDETAQRLAADMRRALAALDDLELGSVDRVEKHREIRQILDEINSYFS